MTSSGSNTQREHGARLWRTPSRICCSAAFVLSSMVCPRGGHDADGGQCNSRITSTRPSSDRGKQRDGVELAKNGGWHVKNGVMTGI
eukprot:scaffold135336_cov163-Phaeocystis_antarctica.AAC.1